ncbi:NADH-quinone oxidoreductase subunit J [uncultured Jatrophihabitans sp.]|uniref:NADH-quinone oxidoreductase subunit J n=1 Tax=uncultured Jatrophihabitans sp. TaxID=1610747 RepID=UPI0035C9E6C6
MTATTILAGNALVNGEVPLGEAIAFWILGPVSLAGAIGMVLFRNAVHSALSLVATMMSLGAFYVIQQGPFLGLVQIIVYTGAIMILFLFVLMLVGRDSSDSIVETLRGQRWAAALFGVGFALLVALSVGRAFKGVKPTNLDKPNAGGANVNSLAELLFTKYLFAFEVTSALLIVAAVGAMILAHVERDGPKPTQKSLARERIRSGRPQPLPGPGVLSTGNSIGTPALLPDGTASRESVMIGQEDFHDVPGYNPRALDPSDYSDSETRS